MVCRIAAGKHRTGAEFALRLVEICQRRDDALAPNSDSEPQDHCLSVGRLRTKRLYAIVPGATRIAGGG